MIKKLSIGGLIAVFAFSFFPLGARAQIDIESVSATVHLNTATIAWMTDVSTTGLLEYGTSSGTYTTQVTTDSDTSHIVYLNNLVENTRYYYRVTATDEDGGSTQSAEQTFLTESTQLGYRSITEVIRSSNRVVIKVMMNKQALPRLFFGTQPEALTKLAENLVPYGPSGTNVAYFLLAGLQPGKTYYYQAVTMTSQFLGPIETAISEVHSIQTRGTPKVVSVSRTGQTIIIKGRNFGEGSKSPLQVAVGVGCSLSKWPGTTPRCLADIVSWSDSRITAKFKSTTPRSGPVYVAKVYEKPSFDGFVHLFTIKGLSI